MNIIRNYFAELPRDEQERLLLRCLKYVYRNSSKHGLKFWKRYKNVKFWNDVSIIYDDNTLQFLFQRLELLSLIEISKGTDTYSITPKGLAVLKRGWVEWKINKYANPKYSLFISIMALAVAIIGNNNIWNFLKWIYNSIENIIQQHCNYN